MALNAVMSDIHGNLQALEAVFERIEELGCDRVYSLGDMVGYGARPNECLDLIREKKVRCLRGNHDRMVVSKDEGGDFNPHAWLGVLYSRSVITKKNLTFLESLKDTIRVGDSVLMVHGDLNVSGRYILGTSGAVEAARALFEREGEGICFFGHTHHAVAADQVGAWSTIGDSVAWKPGRRLMLNPGSVGQPRDHSSGASFLVWDDEQMEFLFQRVKYDIGEAQEDILRAGMPEWLATRLDREGGCLMRPWSEELLHEGR